MWVKDPKRYAVQGSDTTMLSNVLLLVKNKQGSLFTSNANVA